MTKRDTNYIKSIIVHYSQTPTDREVSLEEITKWHQSRGMDTVGYHYIVHLDGSMSVGRPLNVTGAHARGYNMSSIGICYIGGTIDGGEDTRTPEQKTAMIELIMSLLTVFPQITKVMGHNDVSDKECPAFDVGAEYGYLLTNKHSNNC